MEKKQECQAVLSEIAHRFTISEEVDETGYKVNVEYLKAIRELKNCKLTHSSPAQIKEVVCIVILKKANYIAKMEPILYDTSKLRKNGDVYENDRTLLQDRFQRAYLLRAYRDK